ncbi:MAG: MFS transporter, partial [Thermocrispum sp.]
MITVAQARRKYLSLLLLRWFPVGLWIPVAVLLPLERGLSLADVGLAASLQGVVVLALELPTGGLADAWGRRPVLVLAGGFGMAAVVLMLFAHTFPVLAAAYAMQGVFRALDSGPLEAWFVDRTLAADPRARLERGLSAGSAVLSAGIAAGALTSGALA